MKLNKKPESIKSKVAKHPDITSNEEDGIAFKANKKTKLMLRVISSLISENGFYKSGKELDADLLKSIHKVAEKDPAFILKLALYARRDLYLRTAPMVLLGEFAMSPYKTEIIDVPNPNYESDPENEPEYIKKTVSRVPPNSRRAVTNTIQRADEITELLAYVIEQNKTRKAYNGKIPWVIKSGVADAFNKFNAYQFSKYNRPGIVTFKDAIFLTHPRPKNKEQEHIFAEIVDEKLAPADTWEVALSTKGASKETWTNILPAMPFMARLRNCKNFLEHGVDISPVIETLTDPKAVHNSKQFPYRFFSAYREIEGITGSDKLQDAIHDAMDISVDNVPIFPGVTFVASDNSGSMHQNVSEKSKVKRIEIAALFSAIVKKKSEESIISAFGETFAIVPCSSRDPILTNMKKIMNKDVGHSTNAYLAIRYLNDNKIHVDRIVLFSDMQCYNTYGYRESVYEELVKYKRNVNPKVYTYSFDLANYGTLQIPDDESHVCTAGGFSDKVLNFIPKFEQDKIDMLEEIENIKL